MTLPKFAPFALVLSFGLVACDGGGEYVKKMEGNTSLVEQLIQSVDADGDGFVSSSGGGGGSHGSVQRVEGLMRGSKG